MRNALTQKDVRELLDYNPITGALTNKVSRARAAPRREMLRGLLITKATVW